MGGTTAIQLYHGTYQVPQGRGVMLVGCVGPMPPTMQGQPGRQQGGWVLTSLLGTAGVCSPGLQGPLQHVLAVGGRRALVSRCAAWAAIQGGRVAKCKGQGVLRVWATVCGSYASKGASGRVGIWRHRTVILDRPSGCQTTSRTQVTSGADSFLGASTWRSSEQ